MSIKLESRGNHSRGYLPHLVRPDAFYFVTFRLADSLPKSVLVELQRELYSQEPKTHLSTPNSNLARDVDSERRRRIELYLDSGAGSCCLAHPQIAGFAATTLLAHHETRYFLDDWVIMPEPHSRHSSTTKHYPQPNSPALERHDRVRIKPSPW